LRVAKTGLQPVMNALGTFAVHGERSHETAHEPSNEQSNEFSNESEDSLENAPYDSPYPQVNGMEENWWTGTD
jgi:hypothetical protein